MATASFDFTAKLWDPRSAEDVQTLRGHLEDVIGVDIDDSGTYLATGSDDKTCRVWDLRMGHPIVVLQAHSGEVKRVVFSPYGKLLATTSGDTTVRLFDTNTWDCAQILRYVCSFGYAFRINFMHVCLSCFFDMSRSAECLSFVFVGCSRMNGCEICVYDGIDIPVALYG